MFHFHATVFSNFNGRSVQQAAHYIARTGDFVNRGDRVLDLASFGMPSWVRGAVGMNFWALADSTGRSNARKAIGISLALPRELAHGQRKQLIHAYAKELALLGPRLDGQTGSSAPVTLAMHAGAGTNPHAHLIVGTTYEDQFEREPDLYFRRFNPVDPAKGGAMKSRSMGRKQWLIDARARWAVLVTEALEKIGIESRETEKSLASSGIVRPATQHLGPKRSALQKSGYYTPAPQPSMKPKRREECRVAFGDAKKALIKSLNELNEEAKAMENACIRRRYRLLHDFENLIVQHPLACDFNNVKEHAKIIIACQEHPRHRTYTAGLHSVAVPTLTQMDIVALGWSCTETNRGVWMLSPSGEEVISITANFMASNGQSRQAIRAILEAAAHQFPYQPVHVLADAEVLQWAEIFASTRKLGWKFTKTSQVDAMQPKTSERSEAPRGNSGH